MVVQKRLLVVCSRLALLVGSRLSLLVIIVQRLLRVDGLALLVGVGVHLLRSIDVALGSTRSSWLSFNSTRLNRLSFLISDLWCIAFVQRMLLDLVGHNLLGVLL